MIPLQHTDGGSGWIGSTSTRILPPAVYWTHLAALYPDEPVSVLKELSDHRQNEFHVSDLPPNSDDTILEAMAADGWIGREVRLACPNKLCDHELTDDDITFGRCPECDSILTAENTQVTVYTRDLARTRDVDWVVVIHGMNTKGAWQEEFSWFLGTTWGRSIPVAIYKYGFIITGVIMTWRRRALERQLRTKLAELRTQAREHGFGETPDVIAHSFGTWLLGHLLEDELKPGVRDPLRFGRIILTGCVLRPDFDWKAIKEAELVGKEKGLVREVLNHYATKDRTVPFAHWTIRDSGPSGRRGFDTEDVFNIRAEGFRHSDLFSVDRYIVDGKPRQLCPSKGENCIRHLDHTYEKYWRPFLTLPSEELSNLPDIMPPEDPWKQAPAFLRGTVFPVIALPLILSLLVLFSAWVGGLMNRIWQPIVWVVEFMCACLGLLILGIFATLLWRWLHRKTGKAGDG